MLDFQLGDPIRLLPCMHIYHTKCIDDWLMRSFTCPSCMEPVEAALLSTYDDGHWEIENISYIFCRYLQIETNSDMCGWSAVRDVLLEDFTKVMYLGWTVCTLIAAKSKGSSPWYHSLCGGCQWKRAHILTMYMYLYSPLAHPLHIHLCSSQP